VAKDWRRSFRYVRGRSPSVGNAMCGRTTTADFLCSVNEIEPPNILASLSTAFCTSIREGKLSGCRIQGCNNRPNLSRIALSVPFLRPCSRAEVNSEVQRTQKVHSFAERQQRSAYALMFNFPFPVVPQFSKLRFRRRLLGACVRANATLCMLRR
jgi:hypothetical protein